MDNIELNVFLDSIHFNNWGWLVLTVIVMAIVAFINKRKKLAFSKLDSKWPGEGFANKSTVGKYAASFRSTRRYK